MQDLPPRKDVKGGAPFGSDYPMSEDRYSQSRFKSGFFQSNLFIFLMGQVVTMLVGLVFFGIAFGKITQQFTEGQEWRRQAQGVLERMDRDGDNFAQYEIRANKTHDQQVDERLKAIEENVRKIDVMKEKIDRLEGNRQNRP